MEWVTCTNAHVLAEAEVPYGRDKAHRDRHRQERGRFVQDQEQRTHRQGAGYGYPLLLPRGEVLDQATADLLEAEHTHG